MAAQSGKDLLLKVDNGTGSFITIAGLRSRRLVFDAQSVDITHAESAGRWRELLNGGGIRRASLQGQGLFRDATSDALARELFFEGAVRTWQVVIPSFGIVSGPFQIRALEYRGDHAGEVLFEIQLDSAGALAFTRI